MYKNIFGYLEKKIMTVIDGIIQYLGNGDLTKSGLTLFQRHLSNISV